MFTVPIIHSLPHVEGTDAKRAAFCVYVQFVTDKPILEL